MEFQQAPNSAYLLTCLLIFIYFYIYTPQLASAASVNPAAGEKEPISEYY